MKALFVLNLEPVIGNQALKLNQLPATTREIVIAKYGFEEAKHIDNFFERAINPLSVAKGEYTLSPRLNGRSAKAAIFQQERFDNSAIEGIYYNEDDVGITRFYLTTNKGPSLFTGEIASAGAIGILLLDDNINVDKVINKTFKIGRAKNRGYGTILITDKPPKVSMVVKQNNEDDEKKKKK